MYKTARLEQSLIAGFGTWLIALLSNGPLWFNTPKVAAALCMVCGCMGASLFHYGRRADVYALKWYDPVIIRHPLMLKIFGSVLLGCSMLIALACLPLGCFWIALLNCAIIVFYSNFLDQYWPWKNIVIAFVCATPVMVGWFSGHHMHPIVPPLIFGIYFAYLAREILKDVLDRAANHGIRFTMVMSIGEVPSLRVAGVLLLLAGGILTYAIRYLPLLSLHALNVTMAQEVFQLMALACYAMALYFLFRFAGQLLRGSRREAKYRTIDWGTIGLMMALFCIRIGLYT